jgi:hypothetical protein
MGILEINDITELVTVAGLGGAIILLLIGLLFLIAILSLRQNKGFAGALKILSDSVSQLAIRIEGPPLDLEKSLYIFRETMKDHIYLKAQYIGKILHDNDLGRRRNQIKKNIEIEFKKITNQEIEDLGKFKSVCGNIGKIIQDNIKWPLILDGVYNIIFSDSTEPQKIMDLKSVLQGFVDNMSDIIEDQGRANI